MFVSHFLLNQHLIFKIYIILNVHRTDIGANLTDSMFGGIHNGSQKHDPDLNIVLDRAWNSGLEKIIITVGSVSETSEAAKIAQKDGMMVDV